MGAIVSPQSTVLKGGRAEMEQRNADVQQVALCSETAAWCPCSACLTCQDDNHGLLVWCSLLHLRIHAVRAHARRAA